MSEEVEFLKTVAWFAGLLISAAGNYLWTTFRVGQNRKDIDELREWRRQMELEEREALKRELDRIRAERLRNGNAGVKP